MKKDFQLKGNNVFEFITKFLYGNAYPLILGLICLICYALNIQLVGLGIFCIIATFVLCFYKDITPVIPLAFFVIYNFHDYRVTSSPIFFVLLAFPLFGFIFHVFRAKCHSFNLGELFTPLVCTSFALIMGGVFSLYADQYLNGILQIIVFGPLILLVYVYFRNFINAPSNFNFKFYLCYLLFLSGLIPALQCVITSGFTFKGIFLKFPKDLGWGNINALSTMIILAIPSGFYLITQSKKPVLFLFAILSLFYVLLSAYSEGCILIALTILIPSLIFTYKNLSKEKRKICLIILAFSAIVLITLVAIFFNEFYNKLSILYKGTIISINERLTLYHSAIRLFKENPLFGAGMGYSNAINQSTSTNPFLFLNFHSSIFHPLAKLGIVGLLSYLFLFFMRFRLLLKNFSSFNIFVSLSYLSFFTYGLADTCEFNIIPCVVVITIMFSIVELINKKEK